MEEKQSFLKQKIDLESPNKNIVPITTSIEGDGKLSVGGCSIEELVKKYDSPLYILDEITLRNSCRAYKKALEKYYPGKSLPIYASKANSSIFMSSLVSSEGLGLDAVSEGELLTAIKGGVPNEKIVFHGNNKSDKELEFAVRNNIKVIVDNDYDLESPNRNIVPITTSIERNGKLSVGGCSIEELVKKYDSPLYVLDEITLRNSCRAYKKSIRKILPREILTHICF